MQAPVGEREPAAAPKPGGKAAQALSKHATPVGVTQFVKLRSWETPWVLRLVS